MNAMTARELIPTDLGVARRRPSRDGAKMLELLAKEWSSGSGGRTGRSITAQTRPRQQFCIMVANSSKFGIPA
jgi:hypothetical protein